MISNVHTTALIRSEIFGLNQVTQIAFLNLVALSEFSRLKGA